MLMFFSIASWYVQLIPILAKFERQLEVKSVFVFFSPHMQISSMGDRNLGK